ncbi:MAG TPA: geranylgeranyl reductase family protein [Gemmataceae bacterium]|jgi:geranylgeranyl reductase family protein|nr:geranylgeranyl reductase family protein [Gemmataceae bacterium]
MKRVAVIGAGPAGSAAAMSLARCRGIEVLLLDRAVFPRRKVCGSALSPWALQLLDELGVGPLIRKEAYPIHAGLIGGTSATTVELRSRYEAAVLLRERFDTLLAHAAVQQGAQLREGTAVKEIVREGERLVGVRTSQGDIAADAVIVCSGVHDTLAQSPHPGKTLHTILGWYEGVEGVSDAVELYFDAVVKPYYGWVFPEGPQRVNIGICYAPSPGGLNAHERFSMFLDTRLGKRMRHASRLGRLVGCPIATSYRPTALVEDGTLIAGEAAALVDPATAEGIHHALASGLLAGQFLGSLLERGIAPRRQQLAPYLQMVRRRLGRRLLAGQCFLQLARTPVLDFVLGLGSRRPVQALLTWVLTGI